MIRAFSSGMTLFERAARFLTFRVLTSVWAETTSNRIVRESRDTDRSTQTMLLSAAATGTLRRFMGHNGLALNSESVVSTCQRDSKTGNQ